MKIAIVLAILVSFLGCRSADGDRPGTVVSPDMAFSVPFDPYDPNPVNRNGATLLLPPEGSVSRGATAFDFGSGRAEAARAGRELLNPVESSKEALKRGKHIFDTFCVICHGKEGKGDGPIIGRFPNPPSLLADRARTMPDGEIYHVISTGQGIMAAYSLQILPVDRWKAIHYVRQIQGAR